jgi:hypothetical protein
LLSSPTAFQEEDSGSPKRTFEFGRVTVGSVPELLPQQAPAVSRRSGDDAAAPSTCFVVSPGGGASPGRAPGICRHGFAGRVAMGSRLQSRMNAPMFGSWTVIVQAVRPFAIHGDQYFELQVMRVHSPGDSIISLKIPAHAIKEVPRAGDCLAVSFLAGQVTLAKPVKEAAPG